MPINLPSLQLTETAGRIRDPISDQSNRPFLDDWALHEPYSSETPVEALAPKLEDRLLANEARIEAMQENFRRLGDSLRTDLDAHQFLTRSEIQKLAAQIREVSAVALGFQSTGQLELRLGHWLSDWQNSVHHHLLEREKYYVSHFNSQFTRLWEAVENRFAELEKRLPSPVGASSEPVD